MWFYVYKFGFVYMRESTSSVFCDTFFFFILSIRKVSAVLFQSRVYNVIWWFAVIVVAWLHNLHLLFMFLWHLKIQHVPVYIFPFILISEFFFLRNSKRQMLTNDLLMYFSPLKMFWIFKMRNSRRYNLMALIIISRND